MFLWNVNKLSQQLTNNTLPDSDEGKYCFTFILLVMGQFLIQGYNNPVEKTLDAMAILVGLVACFFVNKNGDNKDYIKRTVCLWVPLTIQYIVYTVSAIVLAAIASLATISNDANGIGISIGLIIRIIFSAFFYVYFIYQMHKISKKTLVKGE